MSAPPSPKITRSPRFPLVWLVPVVALLVGGWLVFREMRRHGPEIVLHFPSGAGVEPGKTELVHLGVSLGTVRDLEMEKDLGSVRITLRLNRGAEAFARMGAQFWIVRPQVSVAGVSGLDTLISGVHLNGRPGTGEPAKEFVGLEREPVPDDPSRGRAFVLESDKLNSLTTGSPVYYREVKVGAVEASRLADDASRVLIRVRIYTPYVDLVRSGTRFWNAGGVSFRVNLLGAELKSPSLQSILSGGVELATPDDDQNGLGPVAADGTHFTLHEAPEKAWLKWRPHIPINPEDATERAYRPRSLPMAVKSEGN